MGAKHKITRPPSQLLGTGYSIFRKNRFQCHSFSLYEKMILVALPIMFCSGINPIKRESMELFLLSPIIK